MSLGDLLRRAMADRSMTQAELARRMGVSQQTVSRWVADRVLPRSKRLQELAEILAVPTDELFAAAQLPVELDSYQALREVVRTELEGSLENAAVATAEVMKQRVSNTVSATIDLLTERLGGRAERGELDGEVAAAAIQVTKEMSDELEEMLLERLAALLAEGP